MFLLSSAVDVGGAVGVEAAALHLDQNDLLNTLGHDLWTAVEESTEMAGVIFFIRSLLSHTEVELGTGHPETGTDSHGVHVRRAVPDGTAEQRQAPAAGHRSPAGGSALAPPPPRRRGHVPGSALLRLQRRPKGEGRTFRRWAIRAFTGSVTHPAPRIRLLPTRIF
jgi:hypothetical protein